MSNTYSVINDLYGVGPAQQEPEHQGTLGLVIVLLLGSMFLYVSVHPVMRLRSEPPPAFLKGKTSVKATETRSQQVVAQSYLNAAAEYVSEKYPRGKALPSRPPEGFTLAMGGNYATSSLYWRRVRGLWNQPDMWVRSYRLDTGWVNNAVASLGRVVSSYLTA